MIVLLYPDKKTLKASVGKRLRYLETSVFGAEVKPETTRVTGAGRPHMTQGCFGSAKAREFFATVELLDGVIVKVS